MARAGLLLLVAGCSAAPATPAAPAPTAPALPTATVAPTAPPTATPLPAGLFVDAASAQGPVSRLSFGSNIGPWTTVPLEMQQPVAEMGLTFLRFPGGNYGDENNLMGDQIDQFVELCRKLGAEPGISVRLPGGSAEYAAAMVRYANITRKYGVRYWSVGNEPSLYASARKTDYDTQRYNKEWRAIAQAMRAADPTIKLVGPDIHQFDAEGGPKDAAGRFWMREFLRANGDMVDIVSIHRYPFPARPSDPDPKIADLRDNSPEWDKLIPALRAIIREETGRDLPVAVTEVNSNWTGTFGGEATPDSLYNAIWWADVLGRLIRQRVEIVAQFAVHGPQHEGWGLVDRYDVMPSFYVYKLYQRFGDQLLAASSDDPLVSIVAARRGDGALTLMIVNRGAEARAMPLTLAGFTPGGPAQTWRLDRDHKAAQIDPTPLAAPVTLRLPPESVTLLVAGK